MKNDPKYDASLEEEIEIEETIGGIDIDPTNPNDLFANGALDNLHNEAGFSVSPDLFDRLDFNDEIDPLEY